MSRIRVTLVANGLGLGGTEKGIVQFAMELDRERFDVRVVAVLEGGPRESELLAVGVPVAVAGGDEATLVDLLRGSDVVHVFRAGTAEPLLVRASKAAGVGALMETNIFGNVDDSVDRDVFDLHLFMSKMTLRRYQERTGVAGDAAFHRRHRALASPVGFEELRERAPDPRAARSALGLDPDRPVVGRVGRAADLKWRRLVVDMIPRLAELVPDVQVLLVGATPAKRARLQALGVLDRCTLFEPTADLDRLATFYAACDVFASASAIGESQGMAINEALALGVPVVTSSTPWTDNAQVEFVEHGRTGWIAAHPNTFAEACADVITTPGRREAFGHAAREAMSAQLSRTTLTRHLESAYAELAAEGAPPADWQPDAAAVEAFAATYETRSQAEFRPLTAREQVEVATARAREQAERVRHIAEGRLPSLAGVTNALARSESRTGWRGPAMRAYLAVHRGAQRLGLHVVRASYDSPIPLAGDLQRTFDQTSPMHGIDWDPERQMRFVETELGSPLAEFVPTTDPAPVGTFRLGNRTYDNVDAELLYGMVRWSAPKRYVELGSGYSTLVAAEAVRRNGSGELFVYDPYPSPHVLARPDLASRLQPVSAQQLPESVVTGLEAGDVLFVDTSHTVKQGGDVNRIVFELLPLVAPGVVVHFHDIFLPGDYTPGHIAGAHYWTEQYLLQAFLMDNPHWEVLVGGQAVARHSPERLQAVIPSMGPAVSPGAFWIRRRA